MRTYMITFQVRGVQLTKQIVAGTKSAAIAQLRTRFTGKLIVIEVR